MAYTRRDVRIPRRIQIQVEILNSPYKFDAEYSPLLKQWVVTHNTPNGCEFVQDVDVKTAAVELANMIDYTHA